MSSKKKHSARARFSPSLYAGAVLLVAVGVFIGLELTNTTHFFHKAPLAKHTLIPVTSTASTVKSSQAQTTTQAPTTTTSTNQTTSPNTDSSKDTSTGGGTSSSDATSAPLITPFGTFISNHSPYLSGTGNPYPTPTEVSYCNTTPGATCSIQFTMGDVTRTLASQTTDSQGSTSWSWSVTTDAGFSVGTWQVTVTASLNGQTKTANDVLKVNP